MHGAALADRLGLADELTVWVAATVNGEDCVGLAWQYLLNEVKGKPYPHVYANGLSKLTGIPASAVRRPSEVIGFIDHGINEIFTNPIQKVLWAYVQRPGDTLPIPGLGRPDLRHQENANAVFCDGHAEPVGEEQIDPVNEAQYWDPR